jgi:hypothetical protein
MYPNYIKHFQAFDSLNNCCDRVTDYPKKFYLEADGKIPNVALDTF